MDVNVFGLGAIGSNLLLQLAKQFPEWHFNGIDFDTVEERNVRTQAYFLEHVGMKKAQAMRVILARYLRKPTYRPIIGKVVTIKNNYQENQLYIDCFDNSESRRLIGGTNTLHIGFSPFYTAECIWHTPDYEVANDVDARRADICQLGDAASFIGLVVNLAVLNISEFVQTGKKRDFLVTGKNKVKWL